MEDDVLKTGEAPREHSNGPHEERGRVAQMVDRARVRGGEVLDTVRDKVGHGAETLRTKSFDDLMQDTRSYAKSNPGRVVLASLAAGLVLGMLLRGGRRSD